MSDDPNTDLCYYLSNSTKTEEALESDHSAEWKTAMDEEMVALRKNRAYTECILPKGKTSIGGRWVYSEKSKENEDIRYKARYVAKGYSQKVDVDFTETFSPTARMTSVRLLMQLVAGRNFVVNQLDFNNAYLQADLDVELYVRQPKGYEHVCVNTDEVLVWRLLYKSRCMV